MSRLVPQLTIFLHNSLQIESSPDERLKMISIKLQILRGIDAGFLCFTQWFRVRDAQGDDQNVGPVFLNLVDQLAAFFCTEIDEENGRPGLLQDGVEAVCIGDVAHVAHHAQERFYPPNEFFILRIKNGRRGKGHAANSSRSKRTTGRRM